MPIPSATHSPQKISQDTAPKTLPPCLALAFFTTKQQVKMKRLFMLGILLFGGSWAAFAQGNNFYGLARNANPAEVFLAKINPNTGIATNLSAAPIGNIINLTGAALDPYRQYYHFLGYNEIKTLDLATGAQLFQATLNNPLGDSYFDNFRFNNSDSSLYGLARRNVYDSTTMTYMGEMYLATIDVNTGTISQISPTSVGQGFALAGSAIDPYQMVYYYSTGASLMGLDMYTGAIYSNPTLQLPPNSHFGNFTYSCADTALYGLLYTNFFKMVYDPAIMDSIQMLDSSINRLARINPNTGAIDIISTTPISPGGYSVNASSTIDPDLMIYYYSNGAQLVGISLTTGLVVGSPQFSNPDATYFDMMRIESNCYEAFFPVRSNPLLSSLSPAATHLKTYPNPTEDLFNIETSYPIRQIEIFNASGQKVEVLPGSTTQISLLAYPAGLYLLKITTEETSITTKVIKQ